MSSQHYVDEANESLRIAGLCGGRSEDEQYHLVRAQVNATIAVAASIHDLISHLRGVTPSRPFEENAS